MRSTISSSRNPQAVTLPGSACVPRGTPWRYIAGPALRPLPWYPLADGASGARCASRNAVGSLMASLRNRKAASASGCSTIHSCPFCYCASVLYDSGFAATLYDGLLYPGRM
jgi:hypothetical protein